MDDVTTLASLEKLLSDLSVVLRYEKGDFQGGFYRYRDRQEFVVNKSLPDEQKIQVIAGELKTSFDMEGLYIIPALREVIENASRLGEEK